MKHFLYGMLLASMAAGVSAAEPMIYSVTVGDYTIDMLVEVRNPGNAGILRGAAPEQVKKYLPGPFGSEINTFLLRGGGKTIVVDTGFGGQIFAGMKTLGVDPAAVDAVLITHLHGDHFAGLSKDGRANFPRAKVYLAKKEYDYYITQKNEAGPKAALEPYSGRVELFDPKSLASGGTEIFPAIRAIAAYGHTPGHTVFAVKSGGKELSSPSELLIWGDLMHVQDIQFPLPGVSVSYDTDTAQAAAARKEFLAYAAKSGALIGGMHLRYPAVGTVQADGDGYKFVTK